MLPTSRSWPRCSIDSSLPWKIP